MIKKPVLAVVAFMIFAMSGLAVLAESKIVHEAEYYILEAQKTEEWAVGDKALDEKLAKSGLMGALGDVRFLWRSESP